MVAVGAALPHAGVDERLLPRCERHRRVRRVQVVDARQELPALDLRRVAPHLHQLDLVARPCRLVWVDRLIDVTDDLVADVHAELLRRAFEFFPSALELIPVEDTHRLERLRLGIEGVFPLVVLVGVQPVGEEQVEDVFVDACVLACHGHEPSVASRRGRGGRRAAHRGRGDRCVAVFNDIA